MEAKKSEGLKLVIDAFPLLIVSNNGMLVQLHGHTFDSNR